MRLVPIWGNERCSLTGNFVVSHYQWLPETELIREHKCKWIPEEKATNPPKVISYYEELITAPVHCEDGWYVIPIDYLGDGILSGLQHRELIGIHSA